MTSMVKSVCLKGLGDRRELETLLGNVGQSTNCSTLFPHLESEDSVTYIRGQFQYHIKMKYIKKVLCFLYGKTI